MHLVTPKVFLVGETREVSGGMKAFLKHIGAPEWTTNARTGVEKIPEVMGRLCYRSFRVGMNRNVTKVREGNRVYLGNIAKTEHGSVVEHPTVNFIFADVSRVFTHELVRHRAGTAISQESLRFVRLDKLGIWLPTVVQKNPKVRKIFSRAGKHLEGLQLQMAKLYKLDKKGVDFKTKKTATSAMRRIAPEGLATNIGWSVNIRALRWILESRTDPAAEEEIRFVFVKVGKIVMKRYRNLFADFKTEMVDGLPWFRPAHRKI